VLWVFDVSVILALSLFWLRQERSNGEQKFTLLPLAVAGLLHIFHKNKLLFGLKLNDSIKQILELDIPSNYLSFF